jgi:D-glycero-alpha-D-manno-heptose-7-phosphate kinase
LVIFFGYCRAFAAFGAVQARAARSNPALIDNYHYLHARPRSYFPIKKSPFNVRFFVRNNVNIPTFFRTDGFGAKIAIAIDSRARPRHGHGLSVRARAPLRLGFAGGGTDLSPYCDDHGGAILNATISRYAYANLSFRADHQLCFSAHDVKHEDIVPLARQLPINSGLILHRAVYNRMVRDYLGGEPHALTVTSTVDAPPGSGLGASSALVVALVEAYRSAFSLPLGSYDVARLAFQIERVEAGLAGGRQDQYAAAFGGVNYMEFLPGDRVIVNPLRISNSYLFEFESSIIICFTGQSRASAIIQDQVRAATENNHSAVEALNQLKFDAGEMKQALLGGNIQYVAEILNRSWQAKRRTSKAVSNRKVEEIFELGRNNGAVAGKVSGAGGGGFLMFMTQPEHRYRLVTALNEAGSLAMPIQFTEKGVESWVISR